jgi:hypothetical protein
LLDDGARYDPVADEWTLLPDGPLPPAADAYAVWTGPEVVVVVGGGGAEDGPTGRLASFDPSDGTWAEIAPPFGDAGILALVQSPDDPGQPVAVAVSGEVAALRTDGVWRALRDVPVTPGEGAAVVAAGDRIALWTGGGDPEVPGRLLHVRNGQWVEAPPAPIGQVGRPVLVGGPGWPVVLGRAADGGTVGAVLVGVSDL